MSAGVEANPAHFGLLAIPENRHGERLPYTPVKTFPLYLFVNLPDGIVQEPFLLPARRAL